MEQFLQIYSITNIKFRKKKYTDKLTVSKLIIC